MTSSLRTVTVEFKGAANALRSTTQGISQEVSRMGAGVVNFGRRLGGFFGGGIGRLTRGAVRSLAAVGIGLIALPALMLGLVSPANVAAQAMSNFSNAVNATSPEEFVGATRNMAPSMKEAVMAVRLLHPELKNLRGYIQEGFWSGFAGEINQLAQIYFPILDVELGKVGTAMGHLRSEFFQFLMQPETVAAIQGMLQAFTGLGPPMIALVQSIMPLMIQWFTLWAQIMSNFVTPALVTIAQWLTTLFTGITALTGTSLGGGGGTGSSTGSGGFLSGVVNFFSGIVSTVGGWFGNLLGRQHGGEVTGGRAYLVGERGPEVFRPGGSGWIDPALGGGGNTYVTVKIGETELREIVHSEVERVVTDAALSARAGTGLLV